MPALLRVELTTEEDTTLRELSLATEVPRRIFGPEGTKAFECGLRTIEVHLLDTGHFALDEELDEIANHIRRFLPAHIA